MFHDVRVIGKYISLYSYTYYINGTMYIYIYIYKFQIVTYIYSVNYF